MKLKIKDQIPDTDIFQLVDGIDFVGLAFLIPSILLTLYYNFLCYELYNFKKNKFNPKKAKAIFGYSILYLFLVFVLFLIDKII